MHVFYLDLRRVATLLLGLAMLAGLAACKAPLPQGVAISKPVNNDAMLRAEAGASPEPSDRHYRLEVNDELEIRFNDQPRYNEVVKVRPDGRITHPLAGTMIAMGRTPYEVEKEIAARIGELSAPVSRAERGNDKAYLMRPLDELEIKFPYRPDWNERVKVRPDGKISLPLVNSVIAEGRTPEELQEELKKLYSRYLRVPELTVYLTSATLPIYVSSGREFRADLADAKPVVMVRSFQPMLVFVGGEVGRPGVFPYRRNMTLTQAIIEAGGHKRTAEMASVLVLRRGESVQGLIIRRDLRTDAVAEGRNDVYLEPYDVVVLPKSEIATVGDMLDLFVFSLIPPIKNFSFLYNLNPQVQVK